MTDEDVFKEAPPLRHVADRSNARVCLEETPVFVYGIPCVCGEEHSISSDGAIEGDELAMMYITLCPLEAKPTMLRMVLPRE